MLDSNTPAGPVRCAIYTRKSTEEGLEQEFNSLDAQREAAQAYIASQRQEGWLALPYPYDDGGWTGGNMDRPALGHLMRDIEAGRVDCVVVYKVDRLSRSLLDFARIMGLFEKHGVSFVSVTQQFNTRTPVGRLTLNILFSFAQFEREIISERTRDKKAAARKKGKWTGGYLPLGYDLDGRGGRLVVNEAEAERVRGIFQLFEKNRSIECTLEELKRRGWTTKAWVTQGQKPYGGASFNEDSLKRLLSSELYVGSVRYQAKLYRGEQKGIVAPGLWTRVKGILEALPPPVAKPRNKNGALLQGLLQCACCGSAMAARGTTNAERRYRYYVCHSGRHATGSPCPGHYVPAQMIEESVIEHLRGGNLQHAAARKLVKAYAAGGTRAPELVALAGAAIHSVFYDGATQEVIIRLRSTEDADAGKR